MPNKLLGIFE